MLSTDFITKLLDLKDIFVTNVAQHENSIVIEMEKPVEEQHCPCCGTATKTIHDYRKQDIKDIPVLGKTLILRLRKRRYRCPECSKRFYEKVDFLPRYHRITRRLAHYVISELASECSFTSVARKVSLSVPTVIRLFDYVNYGKPTLPAVLAIDEFKGNAGGSKYLGIITDPVNHRVLDILPSREKHSLIQYMKPLNRDDVKFFVSDMWETYRDLSDSFFKNATFIVDKYHFTRQTIWAFEAIRKQEQEKFGKTHRIYFKRSKSLLNKSFEYLSDDQKRQINVMLSLSVPLSDSYFLKEKFLKIMGSKSKSEASQLLSDWIEYAYDSKLPPFRRCANTYLNWFTGITNVFDHRYTNGFTEGCNNKIKVLKRNAYGYRNFRRFRNRILFMFNESFAQKQKAAIEKKSVAVA